MMNNLFSMFDPSTFFMSMSWMIILTTLIITPLNIYANKSSMEKTLKTLYNKIEKELIQLMGHSNKKMSPSTLMKIFMVILFLNMMALIPFNFTPTAHILVSLSISLSLWMASILNGWLNMPKHMLIHMTPTGTPTTLMNFMVVIEMVSNLIRPITLSVRLSANMIAGHLLISLLSNFSMSSNNNMMISLPVMMILALLEIMVALIQSYVIVTLVTLYQNESMYDK